MLVGLERNPVSASIRETGFLADSMLVMAKSSYKLNGKGGLVDLVESLWVAGIRNPYLSSFFGKVKYSDILLWLICLRILF